MIPILALAPPATPERELAGCCESLEKSISPWLSPAQLRHIRSFGARPEAMRARLSRLMARHAALERTDWKDKLDRDRLGRAFFISSNAPCAFSYAPGAIFSLCAPDLDSPASLALDAEKIPERADGARKMFLSRLFPSLADSIRRTSPAGLASLWIYYECACKISGAQPINAPARFLEDADENPDQSFYIADYIAETGLHFKVVSSRNYLIGAISRAELSLDIVWHDGFARPAASSPHKC